MTVPAWASLAVFALTYLFIAGARLPFTRLDRPGGALVGAVLMVVLGIVPAAEVFGHSEDPARWAIDWDTLLLLLSMMMMASYLAEAGFFRAAGYHAVRLAGTPRALLVLVAVVSAALSAFLVNDTVCLMLTPLVLATAADARLPPLPYLLALCMASNAGSAATFTGNPQNMIIQGASGLSYAKFAGLMALPSLVATAVVVAGLLVAFRRELPRARIEPHPPPPPSSLRLRWFTGLTLLGVVAAFFAGLPMGWSALAGAALLMAFSGRPPRRALEKVDFVLLLFFASLFVVVHGVQRDGWAERMHALFAPLMAGGALRESFGFSALSLLASNLFSNVPFVMLARHWVPAMADPELGWQVLSLSSTLAGNLTLVGSVANLIVFELARERANVGFWQYARVGVPITLVSLVLALGVMLLERALL